MVPESLDFLVITLPFYISYSLDYYYYYYYYYYYCCCRCLRVIISLVYLLYFV
jgi:hypothetical protein